MKQTNVKNVKNIKQVKEKIVTENDLMKYEIAEELGFMDKINSTGWKSLTSKESGKIGGIMTKKKKEKINKTLS